jgi:hypothetical protein
MFSVFSDLIKTKNKNTCGSVGKVFLMVKIGMGIHGFTCLLSHKSVVVLSAR